MQLAQQLDGLRIRQIRGSRIEQLHHLLRPPGCARTFSAPQGFDLAAHDFALILDRRAGGHAVPRCAYQMRFGRSGLRLGPRLGLGRANIEVSRLQRCAGHGGEALERLLPGPGLSVGALRLPRRNVLLVGRSAVLRRDEALRADSVVGGHGSSW
ncbi:hypothetical protein LDP08_08785 [Ralstonia pseudosolanacearum]|uniref:hypothetical protein n=1 Tax=Ralstonia pseudosolanacearum TaxID=1310165 RepID=UPI003CFA91DB